MNPLQIQLERLPYRGWQNCIKLCAGPYELVVTADVGPRIISCRRLDHNSKNVLKEFTEMLGRTADKEWMIYGGHRLWCAPEDRGSTYYPDNNIVTVTENSHSVSFLAPTEIPFGIQKELEISFLENEIIRIIHRLKNNSQKVLNLAPWALTVLKEGGTAVLPLPARGTHSENLLPTGRISLWAYTDFSDGRYAWGPSHLFIRQDINAKTPQKVGFSYDSGSPVWLAYLVSGEIFCKSCRVFPNSSYPDLGAMIEVWTNNEMLELESLSPLTEVIPGQTVEHEERWSLQTCSAGLEPISKFEPQNYIKNLLQSW